jgi:hypothetical protein
MEARATRRSDRAGTAPEEAAMPRSPVAVCAMLALGILPALALPARADLPSPANTIVPPGIALVGTSAGVVDPNGRTIIVVRDAANEPLANATVSLEFAGCAADPARDLFLATSQPFPGVQYDCATNRALAVTDANGRVEFRLVGAAHAVRGITGITQPCVVVRVDGVVVNNGNPIRLSAFDQDGGGGVTAADVSLFMDRLFRSPAGYSTRADFNGDGLCNSADLALILTVLIQATSTTSAPALCP